MFKKLQDMIDMQIKKRALKNAKERVLQEGVEFFELTKEEQEILLDEENKKIKDSIKNLLLKAAAVYIGLDFFIE